MGGMTAVFVHGVPETPTVWHGLLAALDRADTVALSLPGFDAARPAGFGATMDEYAAWLAAELERLGDAVDLVGHDWGGGLVVRVVSTRPELAPILGHRRRRHRRRRVRVARLRQDLADTTGGGRLLGPAAGGIDRGAGRCLPDVRRARGAGPRPGIAHQPHYG